MSLSNYPPGVTGTEPHLTGIWPCANCGAALPEEKTCQRCDGTGKEHYTYASDPSQGAPCTECDGTGKVPVNEDDETCPDGCHEWQPAEEMAG